MTDAYLKFPDQATAYGVCPLGSFKNMDDVGLVPNKVGSGTNYLINLRLIDGETMTPLQQTYTISPPMYPKRIWFDNSGGILCWLMYLIVPVILHKLIS